MRLQHQTLGKFSAVLCVLLLTLAVAVGVTHARYNNTTSWTGYYNPGVQTLSSDLLKTEGQTVILLPIEAAVGATHAEEILLTTNKSTDYVTVQCSTDSGLLAASTDQTGLYVPETGATVKLQLTVTAEAANLTEVTKTSATVTVHNYNQTVSMRVTYQLVLLPVGTTLPGAEPSSLDAGLSVTADQESFAWQEKLLFTLNATNYADSVELMFNGDVFPKGTRYCVDRDWYVLGADMTIRVPITAGTPEPVMLDFSQTGITPQQYITITAAAYLGNQVTDQINFGAYATRVSLTMGQPATDPVITHSGTVTVPVTGDEEDLVVLVQQLKRTDSGATYVESDALSVRLKPDGNNEGNYLLEISNKTGRAPAGTYRVTLIRMCDEGIVSTCQTVLFVHY